MSHAFLVLSNFENVSAYLPRGGLSAKLAVLPPPTHHRNTHVYAALRV